jgi:hypothetical protein
MSDKPKITGTSHHLPFGELSPAQFERLCLWLVKNEGYVNGEHLGEGGTDQGRDVIAYRITDRGEQLWYFQCKRYQTIGAATLIKEIGKYEKLIAGDSTKKPFGVVFVTNAIVSADTREEVHQACAKQGYACAFWARTELDMLVKKYDDIVEEFFDSKSATVKNETRIESAGNRNVIIQDATHVTVYTGDHTPGSRERKSAASNLIPRPPAFYAEPAYIGSHNFVGRKAQLDTLNDWASPADTHPVLLFEAIGGNGKSMLTWEWANHYATKLGVDWAGRFWYSFYEKGAVMTDFCRRALAYFTGKPLKTFQKMKTSELSELLLRHLQAHPWLLILDGLERVLVAYHRIDAAQLMDEKAGATDEIGHRDPCSAIRPEDDDLLRALAAAAPSKILITSRLTPRILLNAANYPIQGVVRERLSGLRPEDAETLLRSCGIKGSSQKIQNYLQQHCDCHPLVTGVLAGLIQNYLPKRRDFDAWVESAADGKALNLANLTLVQKRNHILEAALKALSRESRQLLSTLALLSESADYETLSAFNPHLPAGPEKVAKPEKPEEDWEWEEMSNAQKKRAQQNYQAALKRWQQYEAVLLAWKQSPEYLKAGQKLPDTVRDLESRGLLQYDDQAERYDLHPVVRGIASGGLQQDETERYGQSVVDYFSQKAHNPYEEAKTVDELRDGLQTVGTLLRMGRYQQAYDNYEGDFARALLFNLEAHTEALSLIRPFFPQSWASLPEGLDEDSAAILAIYASISLSEIGESDDALAAYGNSLLIRIKQENWTEAWRVLLNIALTFAEQNRPVKVESYERWALEIATLLEDDEGIFSARFYLFGFLAQFGKYEQAQATWQLLDGMGRNWPRYLYRQGTAEYWYAQWRFWQGDLREEDLVNAEQLALADHNRKFIRLLYFLRGEWQLERGNWKLAAISLQEAVRMAREIGEYDAWAETLLTLARYHLKQLPDPEPQAEQLAGAKQPFHRGLAQLWLQIGNVEQAGKHALEAYKRAWADGDPYVSRYELKQASMLLERLGLPVPVLPSYDAAKDEKLPWEDEVTAAIEKLRAEVKAKLAAKDAPGADKKE